MIAVINGSGLGGSLIGKLKQAQAQAVGLADQSGATKIAKTAAERAKTGAEAAAKKGEAAVKTGAAKV